MIRINLLQEKKKSARVDRGNRSVLTGVALAAGAAAVVLFLVHLPLAATIDEIRDENAKRQKNIKRLTEETKEFDTISALLKSAQEQEDAIRRLNSARAVPSWMLYELSNILTKGHQPTMSRETSDNIKVDANRQYNLAWDPKRLWIDYLEERDGLMTLRGGAQSVGDVTQFALRMQASVFFTNVTPITMTAAVDGPSKLAFYNFVLTGRVLY